MLVRGSGSEPKWRTHHRHRRFRWVLPVIVAAAALLLLWLARALRW